MPVYTIEKIKTDAAVPVKCIIHCKVLKIVDLDTFVIGDGTGIVVLDTSRHPKLSGQIPNMSYMKIFAPRYENGKLITRRLTLVHSAYPLHIVESGDLSHFVSTTTYKSIKDLEGLKYPTTVNMKLKFVNKLEPRRIKYCMAEFLTSLDPKGDFIEMSMDITEIKDILVNLSKSTPVDDKYILCVNVTAEDESGTPINVTMYAKTWEEVEIGQIYKCHHLQLQIKIPVWIQHKFVSLRTTPETSFYKTSTF